MFEKTKFFAESWNVAWRERQPELLTGNNQSEFHVIKNSFRYWAADPFAFEYNDEFYIFSELYDYIRRRGVLGYYKVTGENSGKWIPVIVESYHMSYPCIFRQDNDIYIMPEANKSGTLYLYKAVEFPYKWKKETILYKGVRYADTTPIVPENYTKLITYEVSDPYHPKVMYLNTEKRGEDQILKLPNVELRRSAGKPYQVNGKVIRPAQNCTDKYGQGLVFYEDTFPADEILSEKEIKRVFPEDLILDRKIYLDGMHTYNISEHYEVVDIKTRRFNILNLICRFVGKISDRVKGKLL